ncbi:MAG: TasA family protein [Candidatus Saccharibacteria bacterium]|nr:TasA family protein [Candidatus Saccharibacteria bacterium]
MKRLALSLVSIAFISILAIGATSAYFSDQSTAAGNTFAAGRIDLDLNGKDSLTHAYSVNGIAPGAWDYAGQVVLKNDGSVDGRAWLEIKNVKTNGNGALGNLVKASFQENVSPWTRFGGDNSVKASQNIKVDLFDLKAGASMPLVVYAVWPNGTPATDNPAQGEITTFVVVFHLDQKMH